MKIAQRLKQNEDLWPRISLVLSIGFLALSVILLLLGNKLLEESTDRVLENRLVIAELIANQIDRSFEVVISEMRQVYRQADFGENGRNPSFDSQFLEDLETSTGLQVVGIYYVNSTGEAVISHLESATWPEDVDLKSVANIDDEMISTPWHDPDSGNLLVAISIPAYSSGQFIGHLGCIVNLDEAKIRTLLTDAVLLDHTAHGILIDEQGRSLVSTFDLPFLSEGEHHMFYRRAIANGVPIVENVLFELDLPGEPVGHHHIMAVAPLQTVKWGVAIGGDVFGETFAGPYQLFIWLSSFFILAVIGTWGATLLGTKKLIEPVRTVNLKFDLIKQIGQVKDWDELIALIVRVPSIFLPVSSSRLFFQGRDSRVVEISAWTSENLGSENLFPSADFEVCADCPIWSKSAQATLQSCTSVPTMLQGHSGRGYCLPLIHNSEMVGVLQFWLSTLEPLSEIEKEVIINISADMAVALDSHKLQRSYLKEVEVTQSEKRRIFRRLHDRLGQNISFLRLKLDQYSTIGDLNSLTDIQQDMEQLRDIANEAYDQIRGTLDDLTPGTQKDLVEALRLRAMAIEKRTHIRVEIDMSGEPASLPEYTKRHVLAICFETLNNIEQHAGAENAGIKIDWKREMLTVTIVDDGTGFIVEEVPTENHYGLDIMRERTRLIGADLSLSSSLNNGTKLILQVPIHETPPFYNTFRASGQIRKTP